MNNKKVIIKYSDEFENMVFKRAIELNEQGLTEGILDEKLGGLTVYIDKVPALCMYHVTMKKNATVLAGKTICVGGNE